MIYHVEVVMLAVQGIGGDEIERKVIVAALGLSESKLSKPGLSTASV